MGLRVSDTVDTALPLTSADAVEAQLLGYLSSARASVTDWNRGRFLRTMMKLWEIPLADVKAAIRTIVKGGFPLEADADWIGMLADQKYNLTRNVDLGGNRFANTFTQQLLTLTCAAGSGPYTFASGTLVVRSPITGNRYRSISTVTVPGSSSAPVTVQAESANDSTDGLNYADAPGTLTELQDPRPGLTASNVAPQFSGVSSSAVGLGVVTVGGTPPAAPTAYEVEITTSGQVGVAVFQYRANGGPWITGVTTSASFVIPSGPTIHFANDGGGSNPSFVIEDDYSFSSPGSPVIQQGLDPETDGALLARCQARWPSLDDDDETDKHETWARASRPSSRASGSPSTAPTRGGCSSPSPGRRTRSPAAS